MNKSPTGSGLPSSQPSLEEVCDFARGLGDEEGRVRLQKLFVSDADSTRSLRAFVVLRALAAEGSTDPVQVSRLWSERSVESSVASARRVSRRLAGIAEVPMVSEVEVVKRDTAGLRASSSHERRLRVRSAGVVVEVLVDEHSVQDRTVVVGEILDDSSMPKPMADIALVLQDDHRILASLRSKTLGEFQSEVHAEGSLTLSVVLSEGETLRIPLLSGGAAC